MDGYKNTDIGVIPEDWELFQLGEVATFRRGSFPQPYGLDKWYDDDNGYPFVQVYDVGNNLTLKETTKRKISKEAAEKSVLAKKGTLLLTIQGSIGRMAIAHYDTYVDRTLLLFNSFKVPMDKQFFMYTVFRLFELEKQRAHGSTIKTITKAQLTKFRIPLPSLPEQRKIAEVLSTVDEKINIINQQILEIGELKKGLLQRLLTKGIGHTEFKDSPLGKIPKSWTVRNIDQVAVVKMGQSPKSSSYNEQGEGLLLIQGNADIENRVSKPRVYTTEPTQVCNVDDLLMTVRAPVGAMAKSKHHACLGRGMCAFIPLAIHKEYLYQFLLAFEDSWSNIEQGSTFTAVSGKDIRSLKIPIPTKDEQILIANIFSCVDDKLNCLKIQCKETKELKIGLMQQILTGRRRVSQPLEA